MTNTDNSAVKENVYQKVSKIRKAVEGVCKDTKGFNYKNYPQIKEI